MTSKQAAATDAFAADSVFLLGKLSGGYINKQAIPDNRAVLKQLAGVATDRALFFRSLRHTCQQDTLFSDEFTLLDSSTILTPAKHAVYATVSSDLIGYHLRLFVRYVNPDFQQLRKVIFQMDGQKKTYAPTFGTESDNTGNWAQSEDLIDADNIALLLRLINAQQLTITYHTGRSRQTRTISPTEQTAMRHMLEIYKGLLLGYAF
ncbi:hypothetical protein C8P68_10511 [Mucilaginibacter yixingensis]|uniref:Uncharacterized protein n=1 Tax=Mucilaginibacter yixingensis TaxID=1295612 RepID=A0A2T5J7T5_9SPHI|nr:hypothetical protein [Mucilaginibacter yixingensis]PTQ95506.1 hypothetical protein C8P68_10511 [Mucilaginibacter yixingensis]